MKMKKYLMTLLLASTALFVHATEHDINFGVGGSNTYSPSSLTVNVGDTILWLGDFSSHPLTSLTIPAGAAAFSQSTGSGLYYVVTQPGTYNYKCTVHSGMTGSFTANAVSTGISSVANYNEFKIFPTTVQNTINIDLGNATKANIVITNLLGDKVFNGDIFDNATIDVSSFNSGLYFVNIYDADRLKATKRFFKQ